MNRLKDLRNDHDLKQEDVAKKLNISRQYYSRYELGEIDLPIRHYITLAKYYNVSLDYLTGLIETPQPLETGRTVQLVGLSQKQQNLLTAYKSHPEYQKAIDKILDI